MAIFVTSADFGTGKYQLHIGTYSVTNLDAYIDKYEKRYLVELLGANLFGEFEADVILGGGLPTEARFIQIFNPFQVDYSYVILYSEGIKEMLLGFIYFEYLKDQIVQITTIGTVVPSGENSRDSNSLYSQMYTRYNEAVRTYRAIQEYIIKNSGDYGDFNGAKKLLTGYL